MSNTQQQLPSLDGNAKPKRRKAAETPNKVIQESPPTVTGYLPRRVDVRLRGRHSEILHAKLRLLQDKGAQLKDGTEVSDRTKVILWILENEVTL